MKNAIIAAVGVVMLCFASTTANAATTTTTTFNVTATVQATCVVSAAPLAFGTYNGTQTTNSSTVTVTCTNLTPYNVGLDQGTATGATVTTRKMSNGPNTLNYALYSDGSRSVNWGNTTGTDTVTGTGTGSAQSLTVYGQIPAGQYVTPGLYSDTITATITY